MTTAIEATPRQIAQLDPANEYATFLRVRDDGDLMTRVEAQLESWLRVQKNWDPPTESSGFHRGPEGMEFLALHRTSSDGRSFRARLTEPRDTGTWRTTLTVHSPHDGDAWIRLRVTNSLGRPPAVPKLMTFLLEALEVRDGDTWLSATPRVVHLPDVEDFAEEISHFGREGLAFVAGTSIGADVEAFAAKVARWTRDVRGLAQVAVLDPAATSAFNEIMGRTHQAPPGALRTYLPDVDPAMPDDGRRHRILGTARQQHMSDSAIAQMLGRVARRHAAQRPRPARFTAVDHALTRQEDQLLVEALRPVEDKPAAQKSDVTAHRSADTGGESKATRAAKPGIGEEVATYLAQVALVTEVLGITELNEASLSEVAALAARGRASAESVDRITHELQERRDQIVDLDNELGFYRELADDQELELFDAQDRATRLEDEARWLRGRLAAAQDFESAFGAVPASELTAYPENFAELLDRAPELEVLGVVVTADPKDVSSLDEHDTIGRLVRVAWDGLLALGDYVRARADNSCTHGLKYYFEHTPSGYRSMPPKKFAENETASTMDGWGDLRALPVPLECSDSGFATMTAHFKLGKVGIVSPRMYVLDDWSRTSKVYVGYIGDHMRNTKTN